MVDLGVGRGMSWRGFKSGGFGGSHGNGVEIRLCVCCLRGDRNYEDGEGSRFWGGEMD